jgi:tetratricopeptide (TPR) repeat protein
MNFEQVLRSGGGGPNIVDPDLKAFADACRRFDHDARERQRIRGLADLIDAEDARYEEAMMALERGDTAAAEGLLRRAANAGIGEADYLLARLLEQQGELREALEYYRQAHLEGDTRATVMLAFLTEAPIQATEIRDS